MFFTLQQFTIICGLTFTAQEGQLDCLIWLNKYTSIKKTTTDGMTPSHVAAQEGRLDCLRYLLRVDRVEAMKDDKSGCSPIHYGKNNRPFFIDVS